MVINLFKDNFKLTVAILIKKLACNFSENNINTIQKLIQLLYN
jgi:hypothetical protein